MYFFFCIFDCDLATVALASYDLQSYSHLEVLWEIFHDFGASVAVFGPLSRPMLAVLGRPWGLCGRPWAVLGAMLAVLGRS